MVRTDGPLVREAAAELWVGVLAALEAGDVGVAFLLLVLLLNSGGSGRQERAGAEAAGADQDFYGRSGLQRGSPSRGGGATRRRRRR